MLKKITGGIVSAVMLAASLGTAGFADAVQNRTVAAADNPNYAEALQKDLFFYECQQAGPLPEWNRVEWRADSTMIDEIQGGWYDAGDHVKFNLPMAFTASMMAWGLYQYPDGLEKCGELDTYVNNLEFVMDYLEACDLGDEIVFQVGNGTMDHTWWGPVELYEYGMTDQGNSYEDARAILKSSDGCSAVFGGMAAALAAGYCALEGRVDDAKREGYLAAAENMFKLADASKSDAVYNDSNASGFYRSSHFYDELFYSSNWLYIATGDQAYLDKATSYIPNLDKELGQDVLKFTWAHCWDDTMQGAMLLYAINTKNSTYINHVEKHLNYWLNDVSELEGGLRWNTTWGCLRYPLNTGFLAAVACDTILADKNTAPYEEFYKEQIDYVLGNNPLNMSYMVGYGENYPHNPHHRTAHASWKNDLAIPEENRHILYGALAGGPNQDGSYEDDRQNYINNEVADDYNAGLTALLCKMVDVYGGETDPNFPEKEAHDGPEVFVETLMKTSAASGVTLSLKFTNHTAWPARVVDNVSYRYYMDLSELIAAGYSASDVVIRVDRDQAAMYSGEGVAPAQVSAPIQYDGNIYYIEVTYPDGRAALPISEGRHQCELMLAIVYPDYGSGWDAANDFSNEGILDSEDPVVTMNIPVYVDGKLYYGTEPDGTTANGDADITPDEEDPAVPSEPVPTEPEETTENEEPSSDTENTYGDVNCDGKVNISDVLALNKNLLGGEVLTDEGIANADVDLDGSPTSTDALNILKFVIKIITVLPV
ncbi:MAG: glycoside hydrolase family 9 protein [Oscillospiraceae bacterium]|nr:glycoside hydrolase family 9 protein [Oscillospiraceae bacterium]